MKKKKEKSQRYNLTQQFGNKLLPDNTTLGCSCDFIIGKTIFSYSVTPVTKKKLSLNPTKTQYYVIQTDSKQICSYSTKEKMFATTRFCARNIGRIYAGS